MVWCGVVWCGVVWCGVAWSGVVWCGVVWCGVVLLGDSAVCLSFNHNKGATKTDTFFGNGSAVPGKTEVVPGV